MSPSVASRSLPGMSQLNATEDASELAESASTVSSDVPQRMTHRKGSESTTASAGGQRGGNVGGALLPASRPRRKPASFPIQEVDAGVRLDAWESRRIHYRHCIRRISDMCTHEASFEPFNLRIVLIRNISGITCSCY
jgi:hypothetical protein